MRTRNKKQELLCEFCKTKIVHLFMVKGGYFSCHLCFRLKKDEEIGKKMERELKQQPLDLGEFKVKLREIKGTNPLTPEEKRWDGVSQ